MGVATREHAIVGRVRGHFYLDETVEGHARALEAVRGLAARLSDGDLVRVASALMDDDFSVVGKGGHRLVWEGMSRVYAPVGEEERYITPDIDARVARVCDVVGDDLGALAAIERQRHAHFVRAPGVAASRMIAGDDTADASMMIDSDNLAAMRWLMDELEGKVDLIYADPPYNSGERLFRYRDRFSPAAWLTMMRDRLALMARLVASTGAAAFSINEAYGSELKLLCDEAFGRANFLTALTVRVRHEDRVLKGARAYQDVTEQVLLYRGSAAFVPPRRKRPSRDHEYEWGVDVRGGAERIETIEGRRVEFYAPGAFELTRGGAPEGLKRINIRGALREANSSGRFFVAHLERHFGTHRGWLVRVHGMGGDGIGYRDFVIPSEGPRRNADYLQGRPVGRARANELPHANYADFEKDFNRVAGEDGARFRNGKKPVALLRHIMTLTGIDAKPDAVVLDPFAGSGSTAAAVMSLDAETRGGGGSGGGRRFVVIDKGEHLHTVAVARVERLMGDPAQHGRAVRFVALR